MPESKEQTSIRSEVRPYRPEDRAAVRHIAYLTGLFGDPITAFVPDEELFADLWTTVYTDVFSELALVATLEAQTVGYIIGVANGRALTMAYLRHVLPLVASRSIRGEYRNWRKSLPYIVRLALEPAAHAPLEDFPAHLHINLLEQARGHGLGRALLEQFLLQLEALGVPGVQLSTTDRNVAAVHLYERFGFRVWSSNRIKAYEPMFAGGVNRLVMVRSLKPDSRPLKD
jgi:ribosomal protein S18 acetylase RimI-like enzyme